IGNRDEVCALGGCDSAEDALAWALDHASIAAVTLSEAGSLVANSSRIHRIAAAPVDRVVDTTGAGDAYAAGFLHALLDGADLVAAGRTGAELAASVVCHHGARPGLTPA